MPAHTRNFPPPFYCLSSPFINSLITRYSYTAANENENFFYLVKMLFTRLSHTECNIKWNCSEPPARNQAHDTTEYCVFLLFIFYPFLQQSVVVALGVGSFSSFLLFFIIRSFDVFLFLSFFCDRICDDVLVIFFKWMNNFFFGCWEREGWWWRELNYPNFSNEIIRIVACDEKEVVSVYITSITLTLSFSFS